MKYLVLLTFIPFLNFANTAEPSDSTNNEESSELTWLSIEEVMELHQKEPKYWLVDVYTDWCGWCKRMDASTFTDSIIINELNKNFYTVKFDGEAKRDIVIGDRTYKFVPNGRRGYHELAAEMLNGQLSYPTLVLFNNDGKVLQPLPGYKTPEQLLPILVYIGSGEYGKTSWTDFQTSFVSPYKSEIEE